MQPPNVTFSDTVQTAIGSNQVSLTGTVINNGTGTALNVMVTGSANSGSWTGDKQTVGTLYPGNTAPYQLSLHFPDSARGQNTTLTVFVSTSGAESNTQDNQQQVTVYIPPAPIAALSLSNLSVSPLGGTLQVQVMANNSGNAPAPNVVVEVYSKSSGWDSKQSSLSLSANDQQSVTLTLPIPDSAWGQTHTIVSYITSATTDSTPGDNQLTTTITLPPRLADLKLSNLTTSIDGDQLTMNATLTNVGAAAAPNIVLYVVPESGLWPASSQPLADLKAGDQTTVKMTLPIPRQAYGTTQSVGLGVSTTIQETSYANNQAIGQISIPMPMPKWPILVAFAGFMIGATFVIPKVVINNRHRQWQKKAVEDKLSLPCENGEFQCRKTSADPNLALYKITHLDVVAYTMDSGRPQQQLKIEDDTVHDLNEGLKYRRLHQEQTKLEPVCTAAARQLLKDIAAWQKHERDRREVFITGHIEGSSIDVTFELYRCVQSGGSARWVKIEEWTTTLKDQRKVPITTLHGLLPAQQDLQSMFTLALAHNMQQFIEKI